MAKEKGGRTVPKKAASYSGVGKNSRRTDQPLRSPHIQDSTDLQQGAREQILQGQRVAPLGRTPAPRSETPRAPGGGGVPMGGPASLPPELFQMPTSRPDEPVTAGMDFGPGPGSEALTPPEPDDDREIVLQFLVDQFQDDAAFNMLTEMRQARSMPDRPPAQYVEPAQVADPTLADEMDTEPVAEYDFATEEDVVAEGDEDELSVETPSAATPEEAPLV